MAKDYPSRTKRANTHKAKPYERPTSTSLLKKVASTVCDLLPSWLNLSSWNINGGAVDEVPSQDSDSDDEVEVTESDRQEAGPSDAFKEPAESRLVASDISCYTRVPLTRTSFEPHSTTLANGDDQSDNSESSASTSGCSSLAPSHQDKKRVLRGLPVTDEALVQLKSDLTSSLGKRKKDASVLADLPDPKGTETPSSRGSLWSEDEGLLLPKRSTRPQPASIGSKPSFRLASFGAPVPINGQQSFGACLASPFYHGRTSFGGASALNSSRFSASKSAVAKVTVRERSSPECISSTARKILNTLERMTTPLSDVKKIPTEKNSLDFALSFTPTSYRRRMDRGSDGTNRASRFGPPVRSVGTPYPTTVARIPPPSTSIGEQTNLAERTKTARRVSGDDIPDSRKAGGKMTRPSKRTHYSMKANPDEEVEMPALPNVPLPISSMPRFNFPSMVTSTPVTSTATPRTEEQPRFAFSSPIIRQEPPSVSASSGSQGKPFSFSVPKIVATEQEKKSSDKLPVAIPSEKNFMNGVTPIVKPIAVPATKREDDWSSGSLKPAKDLIIGGSVTDILGGNPKTETSGSSSTLEKSGKSSTPMSKKGFGSQFNPPVGNWSCDTCLVSNPPSSTKCVACETPKAGSKVLQVGFGSKFDPPAGNWSCSTCFVSNPSGSAKCMACETAKPGFGTKFDPPAGNWTCGTCCVSNVSAAVECVACKTSKPGSESAATPATKFGPTASGFGSKFSPAPNSWECDTCMVRNKVESSKCVACETPRTTTEKTTGVKEAFTGFKFGNLSKTSAVSSSPASFKFGMSEMSKDATTAAAPSFKFGLPSQDTVSTGAGANAVSFAFTSAKPGSASKPIGFTFNAPQKESTENAVDDATKKVDEVKKDAPPTIGFNFGSVTAPVTASTASKPTDEGKPSLGFTFGSAESKKAEPTKSTSQPENDGFTFKSVSSAKPLPPDAVVSVGVTPVKDVAPVSATISSSVETATVPSPIFSFGSSVVQPAPALQVTSSGFKFGSSTDATTTTQTFRFGDSPVTLETKPLSKSTSGSTSENSKAPNIPKTSESNVFGQYGKVTKVKFGDGPSKPLGVVSHLQSLSKSNTSSPGSHFGSFRIPATSSGVGSAVASTVATSTTGFDFLAGMKHKTTDDKNVSVASVFAKAEAKVDGGQKAPAFPFGVKSSVATIVSSASNVTGSTESSFVFAPTGFSAGAAQKTSKMTEMAESATVAPNFTFGSGSTTSKFEFGKSEPTPSAGGFKFSLTTPTTSSAAATANTPSFGGFPMAAAPGSFSFSSNAAAPAPGASTFGGGGQMTGTLFGGQSSFGGFGTPATTFGQNHDVPLETPAFGSTAPVSGFQFNPNPVSSTSDSSLFRLGAQHQQEPAANPAFMFGAPAPSTAGFNFSSATATPPSFNFGTTPIPPTPFQFTSSTTNNMFSPGSGTAPKPGERKIRRAMRRSKK